MPTVETLSNKLGKGSFCYCREVGPSWRLNSVHVERDCSVPFSLAVVERLAAFHKRFHLKP